MKRNKKLAAKKSKQTNAKVDAIIDKFVGDLDDVAVVDRLMRRLKGLRNDVVDKQAEAFKPGTAVAYIGVDGAPRFGTVISYEEASKLCRGSIANMRLCYSMHDVYPSRSYNSGKKATKIVVFDHGDSSYQAVEISDLHDASTVDQLQYV